MPEKSFGTWDAKTYERAAFVGVRSLDGARRDWGESIAAAERVIAECENLSEEETAQLFQGDFYHPLLAACRILDSASTAESGLPQADRGFLAIEASLGYCMAGNFPSAVAVLRSLPPEVDETLSLYRTLLALTSPGAREAPRTSPQLADFAAATSAFLTLGGDSEFSEAINLWRTITLTALNNAEAMSSSLRAARTALFQMRRLSTVRSLSRHAQSFPRGYLSRLIDDQRALLLPSQYIAIQRGLLDQTQNAICAFPTSSGKTLLGELCLLQALGNRPGLVVFVAPYQALAHQVFRGMRRRLGQGMQLELLVGGYALSEELSPSTRPTFVVATPERFDGLVRSHPDYLRELRAAAFDECHVIEQAPRGARVEGLIARLRLRQQGDRGLRLVLLTAATTHESLGRLAEWVASPRELILDMDWRPTARRLAIWQQDGRLAYYGAGDPLSRPEERGVPIGARHIHWPEPRIPATDRYPQIRYHTPAFLGNVAYLCVSLFREHPQPILCICATRASTRQLATQLSRYFVAEDPWPPKIAHVIRLISTRYTHLTALRSALSVGVAYHNASLPSEVRLGIEEAVQAGEIAVVCATTTLAEGVDLPFRFTVVVDWLTWRDTSRVEISGLLLRNIAGRCGRAGYYTEGDTIIVDNPLGSSDVPAARQARLRALLEPESAALKSSLALIGQASVSERVRREIEAALEAQIIAAIPENEGEQHLADRFWASLLPQSADVSRRIGVATKEATQRLLAGPRPIATAASPLRLTDFGKACSLTGLSAGSCRGLTDWLGQDRSSDANVHALLAKLLAQASEFPEMSSDLARAYRKGSHSPVKPSDVAEVVGMWRQGYRPEAIFSALPSVRKSTRQPSLSVWLAGSGESSAWDDYYEDFNDFLANVVQSNLPWLLRSLDHLSSSLSGPLATMYGVLADELEVGVDSVWALEALRNNCPAPRWVVAAFGRQVEAAAARASAEELSRDAAFRDMALTRLRSDPAAVSATDTEIEQLSDWLRSL